MGIKQTKTVGGITYTVSRRAQRPSAKRNKNPFVPMASTSMSTRAPVIIALRSSSRHSVKTIRGKPENRAKPSHPMANIRIDLQCVNTKIMKKHIWFGQRAAQPGGKSWFWLVANYFNQPSMAWCLMILEGRTQLFPAVTKRSQMAPVWIYLESFYCVITTSNHSGREPVQTEKKARTESNDNYTKY